MEEQERPGAAAESFFGRFLRFLALVAGWILIVLMLYTTADVVMRYVFNAPFRSSLEFTQFMMALIVFLGIAYCGWVGGHVAVDLLEKSLNRPSLRYLPALVALLGAALLAVVAWQTAIEALDTMNRISNMLRWPHYPFRLTAAFGSAMFALVMAVQGIRALRRVR